MTCTMPWSRSPIGASRMPNSAAFFRSASICARLTGSAIGAEDVERRDVVVLGRHREVGTADRPAGGAEAVERLRAGDLVHEVQVDVEQVGLARRRCAPRGRRRPSPPGSSARFVLSLASQLAISLCEMRVLLCGTA